MTQSASDLLTDLVLKDAWRDVSKRHPPRRPQVYRDGNVLNLMEDAVDRAMNDGVIDYEQLLVAALSVLPYDEIELAGRVGGVNPAKRQAAKLVRKKHRQLPAVVSRHLS